jgi:hypothetical protein
MIEKLKFLIDNYENNPKIKNILLKIAKYPEEKQETVLNFVEFIVQVQLNKK